MPVYLPDRLARPPNDTAHPLSADTRPAGQPASRPPSFVRNRRAYASRLIAVGPRSSTRGPGSGTAAIWNCHPKLATGLPLKFWRFPIGLSPGTPACAERKQMSKLLPTVGGLNAPWPRRFNCACVAPVVPPLSSKTTPAQKKALDGMTNCPGARGPETIRLIELAVKFAGGKFGVASPVPGAIPAPSGRKNRMRGRAITATLLRFATERVNCVTD